MAEGNPKSGEKPADDIVAGAYARYLRELASFLAFYPRRDFQKWENRRVTRCYALS
jgi:hypothetical protein